MYSRACMRMLLAYVSMSPPACITFRRRISGKVLSSSAGGSPEADRVVDIRIVRHWCAARPLTASMQYHGLQSTLQPLASLASLDTS